MTPRDIAWTWTAYGAALALITIFNYYVLTFLPLGAVPMLLPVTAVAVGVLEGARAGAGFGIAAGIVLAAATHGSLLWAAGLPLLGWICGLLAQYVMRRDLVGFLLASLVSQLLYELSQILPRLAVGAALPALLRTAVPEYLWTLVFGVPVYGLCLFCCRHYGRIYHE